jgi:hypothetical protein
MVTSYHSHLTGLLFSHLQLIFNIRARLSFSCTAHRPLPSDLLSASPQLCISKETTQCSPEHTMACGSALVVSSFWNSRPSYTALYSSFKTQSKCHPWSELSVVPGAVPLHQYLGISLHLSHPTSEVAGICESHSTLNPVQDGRNYGGLTCSGVENPGPCAHRGSALPLGYQTMSFFTFYPICGQHSRPPLPAVIAFQFVTYRQPTSKSIK